MTNETFLTELDNLFDSGRIGEIEEYLLKGLNEAETTGDASLKLCVLNEIIGFYREMTEYEKGLPMVREAVLLAEQPAFIGTSYQGTTCSNAANFYRAAGKLDSSVEYFKKALAIYEKVLEPTDYLYAGLYNNQSLLFQAMGSFVEAADALSNALRIILTHPEKKIPLAVTYTNLAQAHIKLGKNEEALCELNKAYEIFKENNAINDSHFCGCANALGTIYYKQGDYEQAIKFYEAALLNIYETAGKTENYELIRSNLMEVYKAAGHEVFDNMLELCEAYYEKFGKPMISEKFPEYADKIAVGLCGEGSECFGFEDKISKDHDCGPGFAMWVDDETFDAIGDRLNEEYSKLPRVFAGEIRVATGYGSNRVGACRINDFYTRVLGQDTLPQSKADLAFYDESKLATAVNGRVFTDPLGEFSAIRNVILSYYDDETWLSKIAYYLTTSAQQGQYNYTRAMAREQYVTANIALSEYLKSTMQLVFLLNRTYSPYYKWQNKAMEKLEILPEVGDIIKAICDMPSQREAYANFVYTTAPNPDDMVAMSIEIIAKLVVNQLNVMGLSGSNDVYLETQGKEVLKKMEKSLSFEADEAGYTTKESLVDIIVKMEFEAFDVVKNEGGRADCQDNWNTFSIMRKSQYLTWNYDMLDEYAWYFKKCAENGRNLITEKYGRMEKSTAPERYEAIKDNFPVHSEQRENIAEAVIAIQVTWMEEFAEQYPNMAGQARSIHTYEDNPLNTSYETYLRGELGTYSDELMSMYAAFVLDIKNKGNNLAKMIMENTALLYGYASLEEAEKLLSGN